MEIDQTKDLWREAVGIFHSSIGLQDAIDELLSSGFHRSELSLLASDRAAEEKLGHRYSRVDVLADDPDVPRAAFVSTEAIGAAEGSIIVGLVYIGALAAVGDVVAPCVTLIPVLEGPALAGSSGDLAVS